MQEFNSIVFVSDALDIGALRHQSTAAYDAP